MNTVFSFQRIQAEPKCLYFACSIFKSAVSYNNCWEHLNENHCNRFPKVPKRSNSVDVFRIHCDTTTRRLHTSCTQAYIILMLWDLFLVTYLWLSKIIANESRHYLCESLSMACFSRVGRSIMQVYVFLMITICLRADASSVIRKQRFLRDEPPSPLPEPQLVVSKHTAFQCTHACLSHANCSFYSYDKVANNCSLYGSQPQAPVVAKPRGTGNVFYKGNYMYYCCVCISYCILWIAKIFC